MAKFDWIGVGLPLLSVGVSSSTVDASLAETVGGGTFATSSEEPELTGVFSVGFTSTLSSDASASGDPDVIIFWRKDSVPYTKVEKNANTIYNLFHQSNYIEMGKMCVVSKTKHGFDVFKKIFGNKKSRFDYGKFTVMEEVLRKLSYEQRET